VIDPVGTRPPQRMWAVLMISTGSLSSHRFASSIDGSSVPCFHLYAPRGHHGCCVGARECRWDGFPSSQFSQLNSLKRNTLETKFFFFKLPLKFSDQRRKSKRHIPGKNRANRRRAPWAGRTGPSRFSVYPIYFAFVAH
jgi:hypothetical protein